MKKRYAAGLALALVGILSVCGQPAADNTISLTPVKETTADQSGRLIEYNFSGHRTHRRPVERNPDGVSRECDDQSKREHPAHRRAY